MKLHRKRIPRSPALLHAIELAGGPGALGAELGIRGQAISQWRQAPVTRVLEIERLTGISRHKLRPDIYPIGRPPRASKVTDDTPAPSPREAA